MSERSREKKRRRAVQRQHAWHLGQNPEDPDTGNPNVEFVNLGELRERDRKRDAEAEAALATWEPHAGPESGMPCPTCGTMTRIVAEKLPQEILTPAGLIVPSGSVPESMKEKILALACPRCDRVVIQLRESALPRRG